MHVQCRYVDAQMERHPSHDVFFNEPTRGWSKRASNSVKPIAFRHPVKQRRGITVEKQVPTLCQSGCRGTHAIKQRPLAWRIVEPNCHAASNKLHIGTDLMQ